MSLVSCIFKRRKNEASKVGGCQIQMISKRCKIIALLALATIVISTNAFAKDKVIPGIDAYLLKAMRA